VGGGHPGIDDWIDHDATWRFVDRYIAAGTQQVRVNITSAAATRPGTDWTKVNAGRLARDYFANEALAGDPVLTRYDTALTSIGAAEAASGRAGGWFFGALVAHARF
jgi:hypothetical protein